MSARREIREWQTHDPHTVSGWVDGEVVMVGERVMSPTLGEGWRYDNVWRYDRGRRRVREYVPTFNFKSERKAIRECDSVRAAR